MAAGSPRFQLRFTPTYSSWINPVERWFAEPWINPVERWFAEPERRCLERGVFCSLEELAAALQEWIKLWNEASRPFTWTKTADQILESIARYCTRINDSRH